MPFLCFLRAKESGDHSGGGGGVGGNSVLILVRACETNPNNIPGL